MSSRNSVLRSCRKQRGASLPIIILALALALSAVTLVLRMGPHYLDWRTMQSIVNDLPASDVNSMTKSEIRETLRKRFRVNNMRDFDMQQILTIERSKQGTSLIIDYERREPVIGNVDVILSFSEQYQYR